MIADFSSCLLLTPSTLNYPVWVSYPTSWKAFVSGKVLHCTYWCAETVWLELPFWLDHSFYNLRNSDFF